MKIFDQSGKEVDVPDEHAQAALTSGQYGLPAGTRVPIRTSSGAVGTIPVENLPHATAAGATLLSEHEHAMAMHGSALDTTLATVEGGVRGATMGISDPAIVGALGLISPEKAEAARKHLQIEKEAHPWAAGAGEIGGNIATALLTGGASEAAAPEELAAEGIEHAPQLADLFGAGETAAGAIPYRTAAKLAEDTAARTASTDVVENLGETGQSLLSKVLKHAGEGAAYGGAQGAGDAISEDTLSGNHDLTAQKFLAATGEGALFGGLAGGGLSLGMEGAAAATKAAVGKLSPHASKLAEDQAFRSLMISSDKALVREAEKIPEGARGVGRELLDRGLIAPGDNVEKVAEKVSVARKDAGEALGKRLESLDNAGYEGPKVANIFAKLDATEGGFPSVMERLNTLPSMNAGTIKRIEALKEDIARAAGVEDISEIAAREARPETFKSARLTFQDAQTLRARIDDAIKFNTNPMMPHNELNDALHGVRSAIESEIESAGDTAAKKMGTSFLDEYKADKLSYRRLNLASKLADRAVATKISNRGFSPTDYLAGLGGLSTALSGHPSGMAMGLVHHVVRERGNSTAAVLLDKLSALGAIEQATARTDRQIARGVAQIARPGKLNAPIARTSEASTEQRMNAVRRAAADQTTPGQNIAGPLSTHAPNISKGILAGSSRAVQYLANLLPNTHVEGDIAAPKKPLPLSVTETTKFDRAYDVIHDPTLVLQHVHDGMLTRDEVTALKTVHPDLYSHVCDEVRKSVIAHGPSLDYSTRVQLSVLLGEPVDPTMTPRILTQLQKPQAGPTQPGANPAPPKGHAIKGPKDAGKSTTLAHSLLNH